jgi:hypothetical protein
MKVLSREYNQNVQTCRRQRQVIISTITHHRIPLYRIPIVEVNIKHDNGNFAIVPRYSWRSATNALCPWVLGVAAAGLCSLAVAQGFLQVGARELNRGHDAN